MKFFVKLLIAALVIAVLLPFSVLKGKDGKPLMSLDKLKMPDLSLPEVPDLPKNQISDKKQDLVYQWRDSQGNLHFTSSPPAKGIEYTVKGYDPDTNLIQSVKSEPEPTLSELESERNEADKVKKVSDIGNPYSPEKIEKLFDDAQNIQNIINERTKQTESILNQ